MEALKTALSEPFRHEAAAEGIMISNLRHYESLLRAQTELESILLQQTQAGELLAEHIRRALRQLQDLLGEVTPDDVLGIIFSKFCRGK